MVDVIPLEHVGLELDSELLAWARAQANKRGETLDLFIERLLILESSLRKTTRKGEHVRLRELIYRDC